MIAKLSATSTIRRRPNDTTRENKQGFKVLRGERLRQLQGRAYVRRCWVRQDAFRWSEASETTLDAMLAAIDAADKPATPPANDPVNHPSHYTTGGVECIDALESMMQGYKTADTGALAWQIVKYIWRAPLKGNMKQDLGKAKFYLDRLISKTEGGT